MRVPGRLRAVRLAASEWVPAVGRPAFGRFHLPPSPLCGVIGLRFAVAGSLLTG